MSTTRSAARAKRPRCQPWIALAMCALGHAASAAAASALPGESRTAAELASLPLDALLDLPVTGASKFTSRMTETAASVTVITADEIRALGYRTLAEVLASVRGLAVASDRSYSYLGVRGFFVPGDYNTRVLLLIDGNRANDNLYDQAALGSELPLDLDLIERVEFIPGQGSAVYGANALFGVINVITRQPADRDAGHAAVALGSAGARRVRLGSTVRLQGGTAVQWSASRAVMRGEDVNIDGVVTPHGDDERRTNLFLRVQQGELTATAIHSERQKGYPSFVDGVPGDTRTRNDDTQTLLDLSWVHDATPEDQVTARLFGGRYRFEGRYAMDYPPVTLNQDVAIGRWWGAEARWLSTRWAGHKWVVGMEAQASPELTQLNRDIDPISERYLDDRRDAHRVAVFAEDLVTLSPDWSLDTGLRWDHAGSGHRELSLRAGLVWKASDALVAKLIHGTAYRPPNAFEAHYAVPGYGGYELNPDLGSETVRGTELALEWRPAPADRVTASFYLNTAERLIAVRRDAQTGMYRFGNQGSVRTHGGEFEWEHLWAVGARLRASLTLQNGADHATDTPIAVYSPHQMLKLTGISPLAGDWRVGLEWQGVGRRGAAAAYGVANLTLSTPQAGRGWSFSASVFDLFDRRRDDPGTELQAQPVVPQAGRSIEARLELAF